MAKSTIDVYTDDIDGSDAKGTVLFGYAGKNYEIDLNEKHTARIEKEMDFWLKHAREVHSEPVRRRGRPRGSRNRATVPSRSKEELAQIRDWAAKNDHTVSPRGRIAASVLEAYDEAHGVRVEHLEPVAVEIVEAIAA